MSIQNKILHNAASIGVHMQRTMDIVFKRKTAKLEDVRQLAELMPGIVVHMADFCSLTETQFIDRIKSGPPIKRYHFVAALNHGIKRLALIRYNSQREQTQ